MLTQAQKKQLKAIGSQLKIKYQIGKNEINGNVINMLNNAIVAHELIKIDVLKSATDPILSIALDLSSKLNADIVEVIGRVIILYKPNKENPKIKLAK